MNPETISIVLRVIVCCTVFAFFVFVPLKSRFRHNNMKTGILVLLLVIITILITVFFLTPGMCFTKYNLLGCLLWILSAVLVFHLAIKGSWFELLFIVLVVLNLYVNILAIAKVIVSAAGVNSSAVENMISIVVLLLHIPLLWLLLFKMYRRVVEFNIAFYFWKFIWIIPALAYTIFYVKIVNDYWKNIDYTGTGDILFSVLWSFATYIFFLVTLQMLIQAYNGIMAREQAKMKAAQLQMEQEQYEKLLEQMESMARIRHDLKYHLLSMNGLAERNDMEGLQSYLHELAQGNLANEEPAICENHSLDVVLRHYAAKARKSGVSVKIQADIPRKVSIADIDLCIIFGNLVKNAVEACMDQESEPKSIELKAEAKNEQLVAMIQNTYDNRIKEHEGIYESTKHEGVGIGLSSVKRIVEKYEGLMKVDYSKTMFCVYIYMTGAVKEEKREGEASNTKCEKHRES
ncbi:sensor histidine kinase [Anaerovorax odorimutans]|nr:sensor histidine kinase [Anaerovorax odorimutans]